MQRLTKELIDDVTSARTLREIKPEIGALVEVIKDYREALYEARQISNVREVYGISDDGCWMRIANIPFEVVVFLEQHVDPYFFKDPSLYHPWLHRHPEYQTAKYKQLG